MSYLVNRQKVAPGFALERQEIEGGSGRCTTRRFGTNKSENKRY